MGATRNRRLTLLAQTDMDKEKQIIKNTVLSLLSEDEVNWQAISEQVEALAEPGHADTFYSGLLELFIHLSVSEELAKGHWQRILENYNYLAKNLNRNVGLRVAIFDYFINLNKALDNPILVEIHLFRENERLAMLDGLTGLFNRRYFDINVIKEFRRAKRYNKDCSLLLLDLDNFKKINDSKGHLFGDLVLKNLAAILIRTSREEDILCRYGGEEFVVILPETASNGALCYGERLRANLSSDPFFQEHGITLSGGVASFPLGGDSPYEVLDLADKALYRAKEKGRDMIVSGVGDKRREKRYPIKLRLSCQSLALAFTPNTTILATTQDISFSGARVVMAANYEVGDRLIINIEKSENETVLVVGTVVWGCESAEMSREYGIKFNDLKNEQLKALGDLIPKDYRRRDPVARPEQLV